MGAPHSVLERCAAVVHGSSQPSGPFGPAERPGLAGQFAGRVSEGARRWMPSRLRQVQGTEWKQTCEPERLVAGLRSLLPGRGAGQPASGVSGWSFGELGAPAGPSSSLNDYKRSEQVAPGPCTDAFPRPGAGGPRVSWQIPAMVQGFTPGPNAIIKCCKHICSLCLCCTCKSFSVFSFGSSSLEI
jgi:hypothetical protein